MRSSRLRALPQNLAPIILGCRTPGNGSPPRAVCARSPYARDPPQEITSTSTRFISADYPEGPLYAGRALRVLRTGWPPGFEIFPGRHPHIQPLLFPWERLLA